MRFHHDPPAAAEEDPAVPTSQVPETALHLQAPTPAATEALESNARLVMSDDQFAVAQAVGSSMARRGLALAGGIGLACYLGHRRSYDLDFMGSGNFNTPAIESDLAKTGQPVRLISEGAVGFRQAVFKAGITKVEVTQMQVNTEGSHTILGGTVLPAYHEIVAMKVAAAVYRGTKRDIADVYHLLQHHTPEALVEHTIARYAGRPNMSVLGVLGALTNFPTKATHRAADPLVLVNPVPWEEIHHQVLTKFAQVRPGDIRSAS